MGAGKQEGEHMGVRAKGEMLPKAQGALKTQKSSKAQAQSAAPKRTPEQSEAQPRMHVNFIQYDLDSIKSKIPNV